MRGLMAHVVGASATHGLRVVHGSMVRGLRGRRVLGVVATLTILMGMAIGARVSTTHMAIVIIEAGGS
jgi:hypothetical protein